MAVQLVADIDSRTLEQYKTHLFSQVLLPYYDGDKRRDSSARRVDVSDWMMQRFTEELSMPRAESNSTNIVGGVAAADSSAGSAGYIGFDSSTLAVHRPREAAQTPTSLFPEEDVKEAATSDGHVYWYNPMTFATAWKKEELIERNKKFYRRLRTVPSKTSKRGPNGETRYWAWSSETGNFDQNWDLKKLWESVKAKNWV